MEYKGKLVKTIDYNEDYLILIVKKNKEEPKKCKDCPKSKYYNNLGMYFCTKYKGIVDPDDVCIEVGM